MKAVLVVSHGSRSPQTKEEITSLIKILGRRLPGVMVEYAFLEIEHPSIPEGIDHCIAQGANHVIVTLNFLNAGRHVNDDIPAIVTAAQKKYPKITFAISKPIGQHAQIPDLFIDLIKNA